MSDSNEIFDFDYTSATGGPEFQTTVVTSLQGWEQRNVNRWDAVERWTVVFDQLDSSEFAEIKQFYADRTGQLDSFLWRRPYEEFGEPIRVRFGGAEFSGDFERADESSVTLELVRVTPPASELPSMPSSFAIHHDAELILRYDPAQTVSSGYAVEIKGEGVERRTLLRGARIRRYAIRFSAFTLAELSDLRDFFASRKGQAQSFDWTPPDEAAPIRVRFASDAFAPNYEDGEIVGGEIELIEVLRFPELETGEYWEWPVTTLATIWDVQSVAFDAGVNPNYTVRITNHTREIRLMVGGGGYGGSGELVYAPVPVEPTESQVQRGVAADNSVLEGAIEANRFSYAALRSGVWEGARMTQSVINYLAPERPPCWKRVGTIGEIKLRNNVFSAEFRGISQALSQPVGDLTSEICRYELGDARCTKSLTGLVDFLAVANVDGRISFTLNSRPNATAHFYRKGKVQFLSGENAGFTVEIESDDGDRVTLLFEPPFDIPDAAQVKITAGCDGAWNECRNKFDNAINFGGESPELPGLRTVQFPK